MANFDPIAAVELQQFVSDYWHELDANLARDMPQFYLEDCRFRAGEYYSGTGKEAVRTFYDARAGFVAGQKDGVRTCRHSYTNFRVSFADDGATHVEFVLTNYAGGGQPPIRDFTGPSMVTDVALECRRDGNGDWKIASFRGTPLFMAAEDFADRFLSSDIGAG